MATTTERLGIVETKVENINEKLDELKVDVKDMHACLDNTRDELKTRLDTMYEASCVQHAALAKELSSVKNEKDKWVWIGAGALAVIGWVSGHPAVIARIFG
ncbi:MAG: DUF1515 domain-containing protein [Proteobacteria bacterium]|nr:DUF1515 domain-containing protein [Pseudomonadota bacterium]